MKQQGLRLTKTRVALADIFSESKEPLSVPFLQSALERYGQVVNKTTVYREIERLEQFGIVRNVELGDRSRHYELAFAEHHHHLVCIECEGIEDVDLDEKDLSKEEKKFFQERNFKVLRHSLEFFGLCQRCQGAGSC